MENPKATETLSTEVPDQTIADLRHSLQHAPTPDPETISKLFDKIKQNNMVCFYETFWPRIGQEVNHEVLEVMKKENETKLKELEAQIEDSKENEGTVEVRDASLAKATFYCRIGDKANAIDNFESTIQQTAGASGKLEILLTLIRMGIFDADRKMTEKYIKQALAQFEIGGDWEKRNKLKVYQGVYSIMKRDFAQASTFFLDGISTYTATELMTFDNFIFLTVITTMLSKDRSVIKSKLMNSPEVLQVVAQKKALGLFISSFHKCEYRKFMENLLIVHGEMSLNRYMYSHCKYYVRGMRLKTYSQFLEPFRSVTLKLMADSFGVSEDFIEAEVAAFIATEKLKCRIDLVSRLIEKDIPISRDESYRNIIKEGDVLLSKIQKASRVVETF